MSLRSKFAVQTFKLHSAETFPARSPANRHIVVRDFIPKRFNGYSNTLVLTPKGLVKILITRSGGERGLPLAKHADSSRMLRRIKSLFSTDGGRIRGMRARQAKSGLVLLPRPG